MDFSAILGCDTFQKRQHSRETVAPSGVCKYIVPNVSCWIDELGFVRSGPSNMQLCRAFLLALAGLFCYLGDDPNSDLGTYETRGSCIIMFTRSSKHRAAIARRSVVISMLIRRAGGL